MVFAPSLSIIGHWFKQKRGIAMGLTTFGSSLGGTFFPIVARRLIPAVGWVGIISFYRDLTDQFCFNGLGSLGQCVSLVLSCSSRSLSLALLSPDVYRPKQFPGDCSTLKRSGTHRRSRCTLEPQYVYFWGYLPVSLVSPVHTMDHMLIDFYFSSSFNIY